MLRSVFFTLVFSPLFHLLILNGAHSQGFLRTQGKKIVNDQDEEVILKGMGLGGWMLQEGYMMQTGGTVPTQHELKEKIAELVGEEGMEAFYEAWLANHVQKADIDSLASWGFNSVRLPMHYNLFTLPIEEEPVISQHTWLEKGFILTDSLLSWCEANDMYLILDLHAAPGGQGYDAAISDYDSDKPSLWESQYNRDKTVALWRKLAERYAGEEWIGGYDLINETNWNMENNLPLRKLYERITESIREVDSVHIIFIEGNWFANDFTGLTPPWDDNMVYSFHKYWSYNNQSAIQWVLDIRDEYDIPLWLGESGENSNTWFRDCIKLMKTHNIGWAWWPMKKIESISGPLSIPKNEGYQQILDYWEGNGSQPSQEAALNALLSLAENTGIGNCRYNRDVIHAMFDQVEGDVTMPYADNKVPGLIYATDFDIGPDRTAYFDQGVANYHVSTGNYTAWNEGWGYRNDGVDIEICEDDILTNGYNVGWIEGGEWMNYTVDVEKTGYYKVEARVSSEPGGGQFHFEIDREPVGTPVEIESTGGWQSWETVSSFGIYLEEGEQTIRLFADNADFNLSSLNFKFSSVTGLQDDMTNNDISVYPNPGRGIFTISGDLPLNSYRLMDLKGQILQTGSFLNNPIGKAELDLSNHPPGIYLLGIETERVFQTHRLLIR